MKKVLIGFAIWFGAAAIVLYFISINKLDGETARMFGISATINIQATVFCAASAIMCVVNAVGAIMLSGIEIENESIAQAMERQRPSSLDNEARERRIIAEGGWRCPTCGTLNHHYVSSCGCGTKKPNINKQSQPINVQSES